MIREILLSAIIMIFALANAYSQASSSDAGTEVTPYQHLQQLREGTLLVQLNSASAKIAKLKTHGYPKQAKKVAEEALKERKSIMSHFSKYYKFSTYYFYNSDDSDKLIKNKDLSVLKDYEGNAVDVESLNETYILFYSHPPHAIKREFKTFIFNYLNGDSVDRIESIDVGYYRRGNGFSAFIERLVNPGKSNIKDHVRYLNKRLFQLAEK